MTENKAESSLPDTIRREALGRIARLGDLYDAASDRFCAMSMFKERLPTNSQALTTTDNHNTDSSTTITNTLNDKLHLLDIAAELRLSVLGGLVKLDGSAKYVNEKKKSFKSAECVLVSHITTKVEQLDVFNEEVKNRISMDALKHERATHFVAKIYWGANCTIKVTDENSEDTDTTTVEGNLKAHVEKLKAVSLDGEASVNMNDHEKEQWRKFSVKIFGDILPDADDKLPIDFQGAIKMIADLPSLLQKSNDGKGKPLIYDMISLSSKAVKSYLAVPGLNALALRKIEEGQ